MENNNLLNDKITLASTTKDIAILKELMKNECFYIRRSVAKNNFTPKEILNTLAFDPVMNVSYVAVNNKNCTIKREFNEDIHPCVRCLKDENSPECRDCLEISSYYLHIG